MPIKKVQKKELPPEIVALRKTQKWKYYYATLRPRNVDGDPKPFKREGSSAPGFSKSEYEEYIDKLVLSKVNHRDPMKTFDSFMINFRNSKKG